MTATKGIVLEVCKNQAVILTDKGEYKKVKIRGPVFAGEVWQADSFPVIKYAIAAVIFIALVAGSFDFLSVKAYARVADGVELGLNRWDRVVTVKPLSENGEKLIKNISLRGRKVEQAVELVVDNNMGESASSAKPLITVTTTKSGDNQTKQRILDKTNAKIKQDMQKKNNSQVKENKIRSVDHEVLPVINKSGAKTKINKDLSIGNNMATTAKDTEIVEISPKTAAPEKSDETEKNTSIIKTGNSKQQSGGTETDSTIKNQNNEKTNSGNKKQGNENRSKSHQQKASKGASSE